MNPWRLAFLNLSRNKLSTTISLLSIALSVASCGILVRLYHLSQSRFSTIAKGPDAIVGAKSGGIELLLGALNLEGDFPDFIPLNLYETVRKQKTIKFEDGTEAQTDLVNKAAPMVIFGKLGDYKLIGTDEGFFDRPGAPIISKGRWAREIDEVVVGSEVSQSGGIRLDQIINAHSWTARRQNVLSGAIKLKVVGVLAPSGTAWDRGLFSNLQLARKVFDEAHVQSTWNTNVLHYFLLNSGGTNEQLRELVNKRTVAQFIVVDEEVKKLEDLTGVGGRMGMSIVGLILILSAFSVASMMVARFDGMLIQLAVLRALGYRKHDLTHWLASEGLLLGTTACILGALIELLVFPIVRSAVSGALPDSQCVSALSLGQSTVVWAIAIFATFAATCVPLIRLYRQDVHDALRS